MIITHTLVKQDIVLRAHSQAASYFLHARADITSVHSCVARGWREETCQDGPRKSRDENRSYMYNINKIHL